ncbi:MAG: hypothetical protein L0K46_11430 [Yaniella sp.]|nr:hypothetical protein [Yaniella sp.]MDN5890441.1 hypothetical protein [Yaniella sp.]MDN6521552.1 hypothetical protein [Yaniella sp.]
MQVFKHFVGYLALLMSATAFLAARYVLLPFADSTGEVVKTLSYGITFSAIAIVAGFVGAWLLISERYLAIVLSIVLALSAAPSLIGSILDLSDYLSASGYNGFGSIIMIIAGNYVLPVGAALAVAIGVGCAIRAIRSRTRLQIHHA